MDRRSPAALRCGAASNTAEVEKSCVPRVCKPHHRRGRPTFYDASLSVLLKDVRVERPEERRDGFKVMVNAATPLVLVNFALGVVLVGLSLLAFVLGRRQACYLYYAGGTAAALISGAVELALPSPVSGITPYVAIYMLFNTTLALFGLGVARQFRNARYLPALLISWLVAIPIVLTTWWADAGSIGASILYHLPYSAMCLTAAATIWRSPRSSRLTHRSLAVLFGICALYFMSRPFQAMMTGDLGRDDYLGTVYALLNEFTFALLLIAVAINFCALAIQDAMVDLRDQAYRDALTGLLNRRGLEAALARVPVGGATDGYVAVCDLDHFKSVNDDFGHPAGDAVIRRFARALTDALEERDICARVGGEEFCVVFLDREPASVLSSLETTRERFAREPIPELPAERRVTASFGLARLLSAARMDEAYERADAALLAAKRGGRNRVALDAERPEGRKPTAPALAA